jgi:D-glycero-D-manno-heptose 1,7-bisphosphate phosphatase
MNRAVFIDRDGVINRATVKDGRPYPPMSLEEFELLPGVTEATKALSEADFKLIVVTNQPDVATGIQKRSVVESMHQTIRESLPLDGIKVCYHVDDNGCHCRKPLPGMLLDAASELSLDLSQSFMIGDRWRDVEAGKAAGCKTILVESAYNEKSAQNPDAVVSSLLEASQLILAQSI